METIHTANRDFLTNCYAREFTHPCMDKLFAEYKAHGKEFSIILLDIDYFKTFNDKKGHLYGDEIIKYFSSTIRLALASIDSVIFRFGGDEFIIALSEKNTKEAYKIAAELQSTLKSRPFLFDGKLIRISFSGGIASCVTDGDSSQELIASADKAMYISKRRGRARTTVYNRIWSGRIMPVAMMFAVAVAVGATVFISTRFINGSLPEPFGSFLSAKFTSPLGKSGAVSNGKNGVTVFFKSGFNIKGKILKESRDEIEVGLLLNEGQGSLVIKKSIIKNIDYWKHDEIK